MVGRQQEISAEQLVRLAVERLPHAIGKKPTAVRAATATTSAAASRRNSPPSASRRSIRQEKDNSEQHPRQVPSPGVVTGNTHHHRRATGPPVGTRIGKEVALALETETK
jgi:hypothetical protein